MSSRAAAGADLRRCFLALLPDSAGLDALLRGRAVAGRAIAGDARAVRWVEPAALHLTLRFLGASDPAQIGCLSRALPDLARAIPKVHAQRYGIWPNRARPRMLVLELGPEPTLAALAARCEERARQAGFQPGQRSFRAHVTLARLRPGCAFGIAPTPHAGISFDRIALMESSRGGPAATYAALASARLAG